ncbi:MAG: hypothetical protein Kow00117_02600 [Phototrophicales bacterium]
MRVSLDNRLQFILRVILQQAPVDFVCVYGYSHDVDQLDLYATTQPEPPAELSNWLHDHLDALEQFPLILSGNGWCSSALLYPVGVFDRTVCLLALFSEQPGALTSQHIDMLQDPVELIHAILENRYLAERLITTEAIANTAQAIASNPSPQNIVNVLRDYLFDTHIASCLIGFFGPVDQEHEYLEVAASWSRYQGSGLGVGQRIPLADYPILFDELNEAHILVRYDSQHLTAIEPFRLAVNHDVQAFAVLLLRSEARNLGVIVITTDQHQEFSAHEIRTYQIVSEFLTISTLAAALKQQADFVQQGRAALLDAVTDGVVMVLPDPTCSVLTVNSRFFDLFDVEPRALHGISFWELLTYTRIPPSQQRDLIEIWQAVQPNSIASGEIRLTNTAGQTVEIQWYTAPVYKDGVIIGRIYTFHNITPERTAERLRSELLSRISHELRTPLTSIRGFAEFILEAHDPDELPPLAREYTEIIHKSALHLNKVFTDIIDLSRANVGEVSLYITPTDVTRLIKDTISRLNPQLKEKQQQIKLTMPENLPLMMLDADRIGQVLSNLLTNAIKYSPPQKHIFVDVTYAQNTTQLPASMPLALRPPCLVVRVVDQGEGLTPDDVEKIFLPFYRTNAARRDQVEGAGLGLAIAHTLIQLHQGCIWAEPATKHTPGGRFFFVVPVN